MTCCCSLAGTAACMTCQNRSIITDNAFRDLLSELILEDEARKAMKVLDVLGVSLQNEDGTCKSALEVFREAADKWGELLNRKG